MNGKEQRRNNGRTSKEQKKNRGKNSNEESLHSPFLTKRGN
jgi:hypothetical protein